MLAKRTLIGLVAAALPAEAFAQNALVIRDLDPWGADAVQDELALQGVPFDVIGTAGIAAVDPFQYTMIFVLSCQSDALYQEWNQNLLGKFEPWVSSGGFLSIHGCHVNCGAGTGVFPMPPGAPPVAVGDFPNQGYNQDPTHPTMLGVGNVPTGSSLAHTGFTSTGDPADTKLITQNQNGGGLVYYFERFHGVGVVLVGGLTQEFGYVNAQSAGIVLKNEIAYGVSFDLCGEIDDDGDAIGNDCDVCAGFDDKLDFDDDDIPDDCDSCPLANPDDIDGDEICDDVDDTDLDGMVDLVDNCDFVVNEDQQDTDKDDVGNACDNCMYPNADQADADADLVGDLCDVCEGADDLDDVDVDGVPRACDICPDDADPEQHDRDTDGYGDGCDCDPVDGFVNPGEVEVCDGVDNDCDAEIDGAGSADATEWYVDADRDGQGDASAPTVRDCAPPDGYADNADDCDDASVYVRVGATEVCDGLDNDCDGVGDPETCGAAGVGDTDTPANHADTGCSGCATTGSTIGWAAWLTAAAIVGWRRRRA